MFQYKSTVFNTSVKYRENGRWIDWCKSKEGRRLEITDRGAVCIYNQYKYKSGGKNMVRNGETIIDFLKQTHERNYSYKEEKDNNPSYLPYTRRFNSCKIVQN